jgi:hypothetical protein
MLELAYGKSDRSICYSCNGLNPPLPPVALSASQIIHLTDTTIGHAVQTDLNRSDLWVLGTVQFACISLGHFSCNEYNKEDEPMMEIRPQEHLWERLHCPFHMRVRISIDQGLPSPTDEQMISMFVDPLSCRSSSDLQMLDSVHFLLPLKAYSCMLWQAIKMLNLRQARLQNFSFSNSRI